MELSVQTLLSELNAEPQRGSAASRSLLCYSNNHKCQPPPHGTLKDIPRDLKEPLVLKCPFAAEHDAADANEKRHEWISAFLQVCLNIPSSHFQQAVSCKHVSLKHINEKNALKMLRLEQLAH